MIDREVSPESRIVNSIVLTPETAQLSIAHLLSQVGDGGVELRNDKGELVAVVLSPTDREAWAYAEAQRDFDQHREEIEQAMSRRGGVTTAELLRKAAAAAGGASA
jgi:hypothetical protein